jgi:hypothetical protein
MPHLMPLLPCTTEAVLSQFESMRSDVAQLAEQSIDFRPLLGTWVNLNPDTYYLAEVTLSHECGAYRLSARSSLDAALCEALETHVLAVNGGNSALGFNGTFQHESGQTHLAAIINQGLCVIQTYSCFTDGGGHYFSKEYFRQTQLDARSA